MTGRSSFIDMACFAVKMPSGIVVGQVTELAAGRAHLAYATDRSQSRLAVSRGSVASLSASVNCFAASSHCRRLSKSAPSSVFVHDKLTAWAQRAPAYNKCDIVYQCSQAASCFDSQA